MIPFKEFYKQYTKKYLSEDDFQYSTDENKTDDHVKEFVKFCVNKPVVKLADSKVEVVGELKQKYARGIRFDVEEKGISRNTSVTKACNKIVELFMQQMLDTPINIKFVDSISEDYPNEDNVDHMMKYIEFKYKFKDDQYKGICSITITVEVDEQGKKCSEYQIKLTGSWKEK